MAEEKVFHIGDILSITTGRLLALDGIGSIYKILNFMTGDDLFTHVLPRAVRICKPELLIQHPQLDTPEFQFKFGELVVMLEGCKQDAAKHLIGGWLVQVAAEYGEYLPVKPLETNDWYSINPLDEAVEMFGKEKVIAVVI